MRPEACKDCPKPTTIHITQIVGDKIQKFDLCKDCPRQKEVLKVAHSPFFHSFLPGGEAAALSCQVCHLSLKQFGQSGRLGCAKCYETFQNTVEDICRQFQYAVRHAGKFPSAWVESSKDLQRSLAEAIEEENFELAAILRDKIERLKRSKGDVDGG